MNKQELRNFIRGEKKKYSAEELLSQSAIVLNRLENDKHFIDAQTVMLYASLPDEVQTLDFLNKWRYSKKIILPVVSGDDIVPTSLDDGIILQKGSFNIPEPQNHPYNGSLDLIVIPGMAFDKNCNRLGRGKGFYDRFLKQHPNVYKIGICFDFQLLDTIPTEPHDIKVDEVI